SRPLASTLFPYTTLFRSGHVLSFVPADLGMATGDYQSSTPAPRKIASKAGAKARSSAPCSGRLARSVSGARDPFIPRTRIRLARSEEHTSELQSREKLVC